VKRRACEIVAIKHNPGEKLTRGKPHSYITLLPTTGSKKSAVGEKKILYIQKKHVALDSPFSKDVQSKETVDAQ